MIKCNLAVLMAERGLNISDLSKATDISRNTLSALYHETGKGIQFETLEKLCDFFDIDVGELFTRFRLDIYFDSKVENEKDEFEIPISLSVSKQQLNGILEVNIFVDNQGIEAEIIIPLEIAKIVMAAKQTHELLEEEIFIPVIKHFELENYKVCAIGYRLNEDVVRNLRVLENF